MSKRERNGVMDLVTKIDGALKFATARLTNRRIPLVVRWQTTNRCQAKCHYCKIWQSESKELDTGEAMRMLREFRAMGMRRLCFSGGEPLMRKDLAQIVDCGARLKVSMEMNTNGLAISDHLGLLKRLELVKISLDGPKEIHDNIRGGRFFDKIMMNARRAGKEGMRISFATTMIRKNTDTGIVDEILDIAREFDTFVAFQPVVSTTPWGTVDLSEVAPDREQLESVVRHLIRLKKEGCPNIRNSLPGLEHILNWPDFPPLTCTAGVVFAIVESNGDLYACERTAYPESTLFPNVRDGAEQAFERIVFPECRGCGFCGALELNFLWNLNLSVLREVVRVVGLPMT